LTLLFAVFFGYKQPLLDWRITQGALPEWIAIP
jgi:hypothetical protein